MPTLVQILPPATTITQVGSATNGITQSATATVGGALGLRQIGSGGTGVATATFSGSAGRTIGQQLVSGQTGAAAGFSGSFGSLRLQQGAFSSGGIAATATNVNVAGNALVMQGASGGVAAVTVANIQARNGALFQVGDAPVVRNTGEVTLTDPNGTFVGVQMGSGGDVQNNLVLNSRNSAGFQDVHGSGTNTNSAVNGSFVATSTELNIGGERFGIPH